jgi:predicted XRE-type DNA-binding protein
LRTFINPCLICRALRSELGFEVTKLKKGNLTQRIHAQKGVRMGRPPRRFTRQHEEKLKEIKIYLCHILRKIITQQRWEQRETAWMLGTSEAAVSRMVNFQTEFLTINLLFKYIVILDPYFELMISNYQDISSLSYKEEKRRELILHFHE